VIRHSALVATWAAAALAVQATDPDALRTRDGALLPATVTEIVIGANLVYSPVHNRVLLVNGSEDFKSEIATQVWSWDGRRWNPLEGIGPRVRNLAGAAFDAARRELVLFGGIRPREPQDDMWGWKDGTWRRIADSSVGPRDHHVMSYDSHRERVVLFGGTGARPEGAERRLSPLDTWEWDGKRWTRVAMVGPSSRGRSAMVYDEKRRRAGHGLRRAQRSGGVVRGKRRLQTCSLPDRHVGVGRREVERDQMPAVNPGIRYSPGMAYDRNRRRIVLYGGIQQEDGGEPHYVFDTWEWDGRNWTEAK